MRWALRIIELGRIKKNIFVYLIVIPIKIKLITVVPAEMVGRE